MHRRTALKSAGNVAIIGTVGCLGQSANSPQDQPTEQPDTSNADVIRRVEIAGQGSLSQDIQASLDVEMIEPTITQDHTATLTVTFTNTGPKQDFTFGALPPFTVTGSVENNPGILLLEADESYEKLRPKCWQLPRSSNAAGYNAVAKIITLESGESISRTAELWGSPLNENQVCLPTGKFRFEREYTSGFSDTPSFTWGFSVSLRSHE